MGAGLSPETALDAGSTGKLRSFRGGHRPGPWAGSSLTVVHEGLAAPVEILLAPGAALPQRRLLHVGPRLGLQPAPARQGDDAHDDGQAQQQGQEPPAPPAGEAAHHHRARPGPHGGVGRRGRSAGTGECGCAGPSGVLRRRGGGRPTHIPVTKPAAASRPGGGGSGARPARPSPALLLPHRPPGPDTAKTPPRRKYLRFSGLHHPCLSHGGWRSSSSSSPITGQTDQHCPTLIIPMVLAAPGTKSFQKVAFAVERKRDLKDRCRMRMGI